MSMRSKLLAVVAIIAAAGAVAAPSNGRAGARVAVLTQLQLQVLAALNDVRTAHGLAPLRSNRQLGRAAVQHSREMVTAGYFGHESADGSAFSARVERFYAPGPGGYRSIGENLVWSSPDLGAKRALALWMTSGPHRANILSPLWREIGISAVHVQTAPGTFGGLEVTVVTADFGVRR
jgi:uncharacterized protein YkwD